MRTYTEPKFSFSVYLPVSEKERLEEAAKEIGLTRAGLVQRIVQSHLQITQKHPRAAA
jgi:predicted DNA-binding protein